MVHKQSCVVVNVSCGFVRGDDFMITIDSMQLASIESRLLKRRAIQCFDEEDDKTSPILNR